jgi:hypothetical protein
LVPLFLIRKVKTMPGALAVLSVLCKELYTMLYSDCSYTDYPEVAYRSP